MAQRTRVVLISDLSGEEIAEGDGATATFTINGASYEIDLTSKEAQEFDAHFERYVGAARRTGGRRSTNRKGARAKPTTSGKYDAKALRAWAQSNNIDVPARGRIPAAVVEKFKTANS